MIIWSIHAATAEPVRKAFPWPEGNAWALSLSFDDARPSQLDMGMPLFDKAGIRATFYVLPGSLEPRLADWKAALEKGHEIGNHTVNHPCTGNFDWVTEENTMKNYTLERMRNELQDANRRIEELLDVKPESFAYTCGETAVGHGSGSRSFVPLVAELFTSGRGWLDAATNDPLEVDLAHILGMKMDDTSFDSLKASLDIASAKGHWVVLVGHKIARTGADKPGDYAYTTSFELLEELIRYAKDPASKVWLAPVGTVARYIEQHTNSSGQAKRCRAENMHDHLCISRKHGKYLHPVKRK